VSIKKPPDKRMAADALKEFERALSQTLAEEKRGVIKVFGEKGGGDI